ncbi:LysR substrate-binding domain-containing protein [Kerstersia gyiorum]|uniref:LysR substrate-binding domain-containing protein n=1 Tax=Kerstersia gyiorum TaxID=206506 RepID=UPI0020A1DF66|nr:LysR substrate-binding domain-containing protein [Kerstersia gyiorum]MCP1636980.1 DNA-binding transcriptional LysR family regulator [Kerstersia gyiorum]MCP1670457.1 DNA-binding transcriptional LysR family regulator [Kerstersia gyiorum]MCP1708365.1 DNA-binding transcriptional LysR family regulator [Kerstersia gyiorum]
MKKICPSITELQAFEAAARHSSFTKAASELFVTQGAISRQVANLETYLGTPLFMRQNNRLLLTEAGEFLLEQAQEALRILVDASNHIVSGRGQRQYVTISVPPTLATYLLMPLLVDFYREHPSIRLSFTPHDHQQNFLANEHIDVAIQFGEGAWPAMISSYLVGKKQAVVCSPAYAQACGLQDVSRFPDATLLQHFNVPHAWVQWFRERKLPVSTAHLGPNFGQYDMIIAAAKLGMGVGLVPRCLVTQPLRSQELIEPVPTPELARQGYFLCVRKERSNVQAVSTFVNWLMSLDLPSYVHTQSRPA